jgi:cyclopropane fatty-acyl-phospholipid synthase-like methyltransferase
LRYAAQRNPQLTGVGIELQKDVAEHARRNVEEWHLGHRIVIEVADVRDKGPTPEFDLVTLHNNVYYFPTEEREKLFKHLMGFLKSDGVLLLTTGCQGGSYGLELLNLWASVTQGCGPLPTRDELTSQLTTAGFASVTARSLIPGDAYYSFLASGPKPAS